MKKLLCILTACVLLMALLTACDSLREIMGMNAQRRRKKENANV